MMRTVVPYSVAKTSEWWSGVVLFNDTNAEEFAGVAIYREDGTMAQSLNRELKAKETVVIGPDELKKGLGGNSRYTMEVIHRGNIMVSVLLARDGKNSGFGFVPTITSKMTVGKQ